MPNKRWMEPNEEPAEQRAMRKRLAEEKSIAHTIELLDKIREPKVIAERPDPKVLIEPPPAIPHEPLEQHEPPPPYTPPPELVELVRLWQTLSPRDQLELLYIARIKAHLSK